MARSHKRKPFTTGADRIAAESQAGKITRYWHTRGYEVSARAELSKHGWRVKSNLLCGYPYKVLWALPPRARAVL
jgi:hypothetical protein